MCVNVADIYQLQNICVRSVRANVQRMLMVCRCACELHCIAPGYETIAVLGRHKGHRFLLNNDLVVIFWDALYYIELVGRFSLGSGFRFFRSENGGQHVCALAAHLI